MKVYLIWDEFWEEKFLLWKGILLIVCFNMWKKIKEIKYYNLVFFGVVLEVLFLGSSGIVFGD